MKKEPLNSYLFRMIRSINNDSHDDFYKVLEQLIKSKEDKPGDVTRTLQTLYNSRPKKMTLLSSNKELENLVTVSKPEKKDLILSISERYNDIIKEHKNKDLYTQHNLNVTNKILLTGSPGNGKSSLAKNLSFDLNLPLLQVNNSNLVGSKLGSTSNNIGHIMKISEPCVLFFDEIDSIAMSRDNDKNSEHSDIIRSLNVMLIEMERISPDIIFIAATNRYDKLDKAIIRRFDEVLELKAPDEHNKKLFIQKLRLDYKMNIDDEVDEKIYSLSSYSDIENSYKKYIRTKILQTI
jgi:SpoVK/Ycf46/Vps4 family AAA+-type ATPase